MSIYQARETSKLYQALRKLRYRLSFETIPKKTLSFFGFLQRTQECFKVRFKETFNFLTTDPGDSIKNHPADKRVDLPPPFMGKSCKQTEGEFNFDHRPEDFQMSPEKSLVFPSIPSYSCVQNIAPGKKRYT